MGKREENIKTERLFLTPNPAWQTHGSWYKNVPVGINSISKWMKESAEKVGLDTVTKKITNHSARSSAVVRQRKRLFDESRKANKLYFEEDSRKKTFLDHLIEITSQGNQFTERELRDEVDTFIIAGSDTTASTNSYVFLMLGLHKDLQEKVYEEIIEVVGPSRPVEREDLVKLKYMDRFIKETLRLFPVAGVIVRAIEEDVDLGDHLIPGGTSVIFGILRTHTNEKYWPEPFKFDPDRFLPEEVAKRHPCTYLPFSYGPRNCLGIKYAMMAMKTLLATVLRKFKVSTSYGSIQDIKLKANLVLRPTDGYKVSLELRQ
ncbi:cytochrome P450 4C1-like [Anoplophora glabripennis]|uniref:cytochrome P450 4C1-like n=1 Tax=Anoplophora glabripennis TaxID=217634 RepID=UPI000C789807|nr:cytochrome P450 4C1-like [Anoplophora glabripennis]